MIARYNETRHEAMAFINDEVRADNLIAVNELNRGDRFGFEVSVWYRESLTAKPKQTPRDFE